MDVLEVGGRVELFFLGSIGSQQARLHVYKDLTVNIDTCEIGGYVKFDTHAVTLRAKHAETMWHKST